MKSSQIQKYHNLSVRKKVTTRALGVLAILIALIVALTYYGQQVGNFVIRVEHAKQQGLSLSVHEDKSSPTERLVATPLKDCIDACYQMIPEDIEEGMGSKNDPDGRYLAYSFYLLNGGTMATNYTMRFDLIQATKDIDSILRVMIIQDGVKVFYSKADQNTEVNGGDSGRGEPIRGTTLEGVQDIEQTIAFRDNATICKKLYNDFQIGESTKFTIVMWLDGFDDQNPDGNRDMLGAALRTEINFSING